MIACTTAARVETHLFHQCSNNVHLRNGFLPIYIQLLEFNIQQIFIEYYLVLNADSRK